MNTPTSKYIKLMGYKRFHYLHWGKSSSYKIILLHGIGESADIWFKFAPLLAKKFEVIALDLRGHGGTPWDINGNYSLNSYVDDTQLIISSWNDPSIIIGHGIGAEIAEKILDNFSSLIKKVFSLNNSKFLNDNSLLFEKLSEISNELEQNLINEEFKFLREIYKNLTWATSSGRTLKCDPKVFDYKPKNLPIKSPDKLKKINITLSDVKINTKDIEINKNNVQEKLLFINENWFHINHADLLSEHILKLLE